MLLCRDAIPIIMKKLALSVVLLTILLWGAAYMIRYSSLGIFLLLLIVGVTGFGLLIKKKF